MFLRNENNPRVMQFLIFEISRAEIEQHSTERALAWLNTLMQDPETAWANRTKLTLSVTGYDSDPREVYEIPEVCRFIRTLHSNWKYWFFFASQMDYTLVVLLACIHGAKKGKNDSPAVKGKDAQHFFQQCTLAMNYIFVHWDFPEDENKKIFFGAFEVLHPMP